MTNKLGRNEPCSCGSGKKYKHCHGNLRGITPFYPAAQLNISLNNFTFTLQMPAATPVLRVDGSVFEDDKEYVFVMLVKLLNQDNQQSLWQMLEFGWQNRPDHLDTRQIAQSLINLISAGLQTQSFSATSDGAGTFIWSPLNSTNQEINAHCASYRPDFLHHTTPLWESLWDRIENRNLADPDFKVIGFEQQEVEKSIKQLSKVFSYEWVRDFYQNLTKEKPASMTSSLPLPSDQLFPAYQLARTALGALCIDPAWNNLIALGLALGTLQDLDDIDILRKGLITQPTQLHQVLLAAELYQNQQLQPLPDSDDCTLAITISDQNFYISGIRCSAINQHLIQASHVAGLNQPTLLNIELSDQSHYTAENNSHDILATLNLPANISAIIVSSRVLSQTGGKPSKQDQTIMLNPVANAMLSLEQVQQFFKTNNQILTDGLNSGVSFH